jgi:hypothetical protein
MPKTNEQSQTEERYEYERNGFKVEAKVVSFAETPTLYTTLTSDFFGVSLFEDVSRDGLLAVQGIIKEILKDHPE